KTPSGLFTWLEFRRVLFRSRDEWREPLEFEVEGSALLACSRIEHHHALVPPLSVSLRMRVPIAGQPLCRPGRTFSCLATSFPVPDGGPDGGPDPLPASSGVVVRSFGYGGWKVARSGGVTAPATTASRAPARRRRQSPTGAATLRRGSRVPAWSPPLPPQGG